MEEKSCLSHLLVFAERLTPFSFLHSQEAMATAVRIVVEDHLYWCLVLDRWHREAGKHVSSLSYIHTFLGHCIVRVFTRYEEVRHNSRNDIAFS